MPERFGPFQFVYTQREQKMRDTIKHLVDKHGIIRARIIISQEAHAAAWAFDLPSEQHQYWFDMSQMLKALSHATFYGARIGL